MTREATTRHGIVLIIAAVMPAMAIISLVPVLPLLIREFAALPGAAVLVPMMLTVPALCVALFSPLMGWLSDRVGRKRVLIAALLLYAAFGVIPILLTDLFQMIGARVALGIAEAAIMTVATAMIGDYFQGERRERWIAIQIAVVSLSAIVLIAIGGVLGELLGSRGPFWLYVLALPIALAASILLFEPDRHAADPDASARLPLAGILPPVLITLAVGVLFYTVLVQLGPVLALSGVTSPALIGAAGAAANLGVALGALLFQRFKALAGPRLLVLGLILASAGYAGAAMADGFALTAGFAVLACLGSGVMLPNMLAWTMRLLPPAARGRGTGSWTGAFFLGQFAAPIIAGALAQPLGGLKSVLLLYAALAITAALLTLPFTRNKVHA